MSDCDDPRFEQAGPPEGYCDPADTQDVSLRQNILSDNELLVLQGLQPANPLAGEPCPPKPENDLATIGVGTSNGSEEANGPYVVSLKEISELCKRQLNPQMLTGVILQLLVHHFSSESQFFNPEVSGLVWNKNSKLNKIRISSKAKWSPDDADLKPAIIVDRQAIKFNRIAIGDLDVNYNKKSNEQFYTRLVQSSFRIYVVGQTPPETEILGFEVAQFFTTFSPAIKAITPIFDFQVDGISELVQIDEMNNNLGVVINLAVQYQWVWTMQEQAPILKAVTLKV